MDIFGGDSGGDLFGSGDAQSGGGDGANTDIFGGGAASSSSDPFGTGQGSSAGTDVFGGGDGAGDLFGGGAAAAGGSTVAGTGTNAGASSSSSSTATSAAAGADIFGGGSTGGAAGDVFGGNSADGAGDIFGGSGGDSAGADPFAAAAGGSGDLFGGAASAGAGDMFGSDDKSTVGASDPFGASTNVDSKTADPTPAPAPVRAPAPAPAPAPAEGAGLFGDSTSGADVFGSTGFGGGDGENDFGSATPNPADQSTASASGATPRKNLFAASTATVDDKSGGGADSSMFDMGASQTLPNTGRKDVSFDTSALSSSQLDASTLNLSTVKALGRSRSGISDEGESRGGDSRQFDQIFEDSDRVLADFISKAERQMRNDEDVFSKLKADRGRTQPLQRWHEGLQSAIKQAHEVSRDYSSRNRAYFDYLVAYERKLREVEKAIEARGLDTQAFLTRRDLDARCEEAQQDLNLLTQELRSSEYPFAKVEAVYRQVRAEGV